MMRPAIVLVVYLLGSATSSDPFPRAGIPSTNSKDQCEIWHKSNPENVVPLAMGPEVPQGKGVEERDSPEGDEGKAYTSRRSRIDYYPSIASLARRGGPAREFKICENEPEEMSYKSPPYPAGDSSQCYDSKDWKQNRNFELDVKQKPKKADVEYKDEHILELQALKWFWQQHMMRSTGDNRWVHRDFDKDPATKSPRTACQYFKKFWYDNKLSRIGPVPKRKPEPNMAYDFVATAHPSSYGYRDELVMLEGDTNFVKQVMFNRRTYEMVSQDEIPKWKKAAASLQGMESMLKRFKTVILMVKYMDKPKVNDIYLKQGIRIGEKLEEAEKLLEANWKGEPEKYKQQGLKAAWMRFMKQYTDDLNEKVQRFYKEWKPVLEKAIDDYSKAVASPNYGTGLNAAQKKEREELWKDMKALVDEIGKGKKFKNPF